MRLVIDGIIYSLQTYGGISVYFNELLTRLEASSTDAELVEFGPVRSRPPTFQRLSGKLIPARPFERYRQFDWGDRPSSGAVFHSSYYRLPSKTTIPSVVTVHDFAYEKCVSGPRRWVHSAQKFSAIRSAHAIICISSSTRDDLMELVGTRAGQSVHVIYNGSSEQFRPTPVDQPTLPFALFVGQRGHYKNFRALLRAMARLPELELRCVGGGPFSNEEFAGITSKVRERIHHEGLVPGHRLNTLYNQAACLVYPSSYEGFGIPVVEAMRAGCPVVGIDCKAVREVGGQALVVATSLAPDDLADAILDACFGSARQQRVRVGLKVAGQYSWAKTFQQTLEVYRSLVANH